MEETEDEVLDKHLALVQGKSAYIDHNKDQQSDDPGIFNDSYLAAYLNELDKKDGNLISTGFDKLDDLLGGGFYPGLYTIGAVSSLGKTTFCLQIADEVARSGNDVIFFSLEQSRYELTSKSLVRYFNDNCSSKFEINTMDLLKGSVQSDDINLIKAIEDYRLTAENIAIREDELTTDDFVELIEDTIKLRNKKPVIFVDYLQIVSADKKAPQYRDTIDYNVGELKKISRKYDIPVIVISSFNRQSYNQNISYKSFKESGKIEYSADVVMGLQLAQLRDARLNGERVSKKDINNWKGGNIREIVLVLLKNRNGKPFGTLRYRFNTVRNKFIETAAP